MSQRSSDRSSAQSVLSFNSAAGGSGSGSGAWAHGLHVPDNRRMSSLNASMAGSRHGSGEQLHGVDAVLHAIGPLKPSEPAICTDPSTQSAGGVGSSASSTVAAMDFIDQQVGMRPGCNAGPSAGGDHH